MHEIFSMINHCIFMQSRMKTIEEEERKVVYSYELIVEIVSNRHSYMLSTFDNLLSFQPQFLQHVWFREPDRHLFRPMWQSCSYLQIFRLLCIPLFVHLHRRLCAHLRWVADFFYGTRVANTFLRVSKGRWCRPKSKSQVSTRGSGRSTHLRANLLSYQRRRFLKTM